MNVRMVFSSSLANGDDDTEGKAFYKSFSIWVMLPEGPIQHNPALVLVKSALRVQTTYRLSC